MKPFQIIAVCVCLALFVVGSLQRSSTATVVDQCLVDLRSNLHATWLEGSARTFATDREAKTWIDEHALESFRNAFGPLRQLNEAALGGGQYDDAKRAAQWARYADESQ